MFQIIVLTSAIVISVYLYALVGYAVYSSLLPDGKIRKFTCVMYGIFWPLAILLATFWHFCFVVERTHRYLTRKPIEKENARILREMMEDYRSGK